MYASRDGLMTMGAGLGIAAGMANSDIDQDIHEWYQVDVRSSGTDDLARFAKPFGEGILLIPAATGALLIGECSDCWQPCCLTGEWGDRTMRGMLVGTPSLIGLQFATGASRPDESSAESDWVPLHDNNGASGHSFIGAMPFITAAKMTDSPWAKTGFYAASTLTAFSRVNDGDHYTSQAILGWCLAYAACSAVDQTEQDRSDFRFTAVPVPGGVGVGIVLER
ncbi:MAG: phosphatase PAP2 family protein [Planctomycetales bacterium]|nr:phosphatase PAP2 family protein [Planctomycetales bacterium]